MQSQARVLQNGDILKIMTVGSVLHFAQPFSDFDGFVVFTVLEQPCWFIILVGFNSLGSNICKLYASVIVLIEGDSAHCDTGVAFLWINN